MGHIQLSNRQIQTAEECCIACGQCVTICPKSAISHSEFPSDKISKIQFERMPTTEQLIELLKTRRSLRTFRDKPIEKETVEKIIDGARFAPSGHNSQSTEKVPTNQKWVVGKDPATDLAVIRADASGLQCAVLETLR